MIVGPRVEFQPGGYVRIRVWDSDAGKDRYVYLHRLVPFAHGEFDSLWDDRHGHHVDHDGWNNSPENLEARDPVDHANYHLRGGAGA